MKQHIEQSEGWTAPTLRPPGSPPGPEPATPAPMTLAELAAAWRNGTPMDRQNLLGRRDVQAFVGQWLLGVSI